MALSQKVLQREWPAQGELLVIVVSEVKKAEPLAAPSVRGLALDPLRFDGQSVTVSGRFRGRNLFGDQPAGPGRSKFDFVIQLADSSVWVVGRRPKGQGFDLNVDARVDTGRWLEVQGDVHTSKGLVWIEAMAIRTTTAVSDTAPAETTRSGSAGAAAAGHLLDADRRRGGRQRRCTRPPAVLARHDADSPSRAT